MVILDFSQIFLANIFIDPQMSLLSKNPTEENRLFLKHMSFNTVRAYNVKYGKQYGQMVIALDGQNLWRREYFPNYKITRKASRDKSDLDWDYIFSVGNEIKEDMEKYFPFPMIGCDGAEADDVIGVLTKLKSENSDEEDIMGRSTAEPIMILSSDGDFVQLHKYPNVKQFSPAQKKLVKSTVNPKRFLIEKIITGDTGDSVPNIRTGDDFFERKVAGEKVRQPPITQKYIDQLLKDPSAFNSAEDKRNFDRNETLISFDKIPSAVYNNIVDVYNAKKDKKVSKLELMNYFVANRMQQLNSNVQDFFL